MANTESVYWRLPPGLYTQVKTAAKQGGRSANAEAVLRLEASFGALAEREVAATEPAASLSPSVLREPFEESP